MTRLELISSYIKDDEKVIDVGCDHAYLSILLAKRNIKSIASDLRENIINKTSQNINQEYKKYITFRVGNGITLNENEQDYIPVLAGMGTHSILEIIKTSKYIFNKIITISNNNHDILRSEMAKLGYISRAEEIIKEKGKYYNLIVFKRGHTTYNEEELLIGINHKNIKLLKEKNELLIKKYENILKNIIKEEDKKELKRILKILKNYKY